MDDETDDEVVSEARAKGRELAEILVRYYRDGDYTAASVHANDVAQNDPDAAREALLALTAQLTLHRD